MRSTQTKLGGFEETTEALAMVSASFGNVRDWPALAVPVHLRVTLSLSPWLLRVSLLIWIFFPCSSISRQRPAAAFSLNCYCFSAVVALYCISTFLNLMNFSMSWETLLSEEPSPWLCGWSLLCADHLTHPGQEPCHRLWRCSLLRLPLI